MIGHGAGKDRPVGCGAFDHAEDVFVIVGATGHPFDGPVDAGCAGRGWLRLEQRTVGGVEDGTARTYRLVNGLSFDRGGDPGVKARGMMDNSTSLIASQRVYT